MLNKHEILSCYKREPGVEKSSLELSSATYKQGSSSFSRVRVGHHLHSLTTSLSAWGEMSNCKGKTEHPKEEENMKAVSLKICMCSKIKPPKSRQGGNECSMAMQVIRASGYGGCFPNCRPRRAPNCEQGDSSDFYLHKSFSFSECQGKTWVTSGKLVHLSGPWLFSFAKCGSGALAEGLYGVFSRICFREGAIKRRLL